MEVLDATADTAPPNMEVLDATGLPKIFKKQVLIFKIAPLFFYP